MEIPTLIVGLLFAVSLWTLFYAYFIFVPENIRKICHLKLHACRDQLLEKVARGDVQNYGLARLAVADLDRHLRHLPSRTLFGFVHWQALLKKNEAALNSILGLEDQAVPPLWQKILNEISASEREVFAQVEAQSSRLIFLQLMLGNTSGFVLMHLVAPLALIAYFSGYGWQKISGDFRNGVDKVMPAEPYIHGKPKLNNFC